MIQALSEENCLLSLREVTREFGIPRKQLLRMLKSVEPPPHFQFHSKGHSSGLRFERGALTKWIANFQKKKETGRPLQRPDERKKIVRTYFILREFPRAVKIGKSRNCQDRLRHLQTAVDSRLSLIGQVPGDREKEIHNLLADLHIMGEWFRWPDSVYSRLRIIGIHL